MNQKITESIKKKRLFSFFSILIRILGSTFLSISVIGIVLTIAGSSVWWLESAAYWVPVYWLLSFVGLLFSFILKFKKRGVLGVVLFIIATLMIAPCYMGKTAGGLTPNFKIMQANVYEYNKGADSFLKLAADEKPDMILLQEADSRWKGLLKPLEALYAQNNYAPRYSKNALDLGQFWKGESNNLTPLADNGLPATITKVGINGQILSVINVHTAAPFSPKRAAQHHEQMRALAEYIKGLDGPVVMAGDLNSCYWSPEFKQLAQVAKLRNGRSGFGVLGTWPSFFGPLKTNIDQILVRGVDVVDCRVGPGVGSDHRPLITELYVPAKTASK